MNPLVRPAYGSEDPRGIDDAAACARIYAPYVTDTVVSFEEAPPSEADLAQRMAAAHRWLVAELDGEIVGYAYGSKHRERAAYRFACEVSVYLAPGGQGRGLGRALYDQLLADLADQGLHMAYAGVVVPNPASVRLHESLGFEPIGIFREVGWKFGAWHDTLWLQRRLRDDGGTVAGP